MINLRSNTQALPTDKMRQAIRTTPLGDEVIIDYTPSRLTATQ